MEGWQAIRNHKAVKGFLKQNKEVNEFRIELQLKGFIPAGTKAFTVWKDLFIVTETCRYTIGFDRQSTILLEKLYHQLPNKKELEYIVDKWMEAIVDNITEQVELIKQRAK